MTASQRIVLVSIATSLATLGLKFFAYLLTGSMGLLSDALEGLVNLAAGIVALVAVSVARQPPDDAHAFGHDKAEYFSSGVEGILILVAAIGMVWAAASRLLHPVPLRGLAPGLVVAALAGVLNWTTARLMLRVAAREDSITVEADARHLMADVWTTGGVVVALAVVALVPRWAVLDGLLALGIALHIGRTGYGLLRRSVDGLMDRSLDPGEVAAIRTLLEAELGAGEDYAALRTRRSGAQRFVEFKLRVPGQATVAAAHARCDRLEAAIAARLGRVEVSIHVEPADPA